ncbi:MAG: di-trans,poly-cis-decaprenylcistransferase [Rhodobacteraceae bacterium]|nr:MAG: di-trans,poly-cis-decaprenylcistransferase [Paracoccaceae bacterium]
MDGNGRWAVKRGLPRLMGHKRGANRVKDIVKASTELGVDTLTLYAFSTENWKRAAHEVEGLMKLFRGYLQNNFIELNAKNIRVKFLGDPTPLAADLREQMEKLEDLTKDNTLITLNIAINYGGRDDLVRATRKVAAKVQDGSLAVEDITEQMISDHLDTAFQADPDLIIRTAGELRMSNFMTWQSAYSELAFVEKSWPEFTPEVYAEVIADYRARTRQFGAIIPKGVTGAE